jgi:hypothetical protein
MITLMILMSLVVRLPFQESSAPSYTQTYAVFIRNALAGTETVNERTDKDGNLVCTSQNQLRIADGLEVKQMSYETTLVLAKDRVTPVSYQNKYLSGSKDSCTVTVKGGMISRVLSRGGNISETTAPLQPGTVILDVNVFYQYDVLARMYDLAKKGRQVFSNFVPVVGGEVPLAVTFLEDSKLEYGKGAVEVRNYKVEFFGSRVGALSTDTNGRLVRLLLPEQELEVVRKDLVPGEPGKDRHGPGRAESRGDAAAGGTAARYSAGGFSGGLSRTPSAAFKRTRR